MLRKDYIKCLVILILSNAIYFNSNITEILNHKRFSFYHENYGEVSNFEKYSFIQILFSLPKSAFLFLTSPILKINNFYDILILLDTFILYIFVFSSFSQNIKKNNLKFIFWIIILLSLCSLHGLIVINDGTIHRYKILIIIPLLYGYLHSLKKINV